MKLLACIVMLVDYGRESAGGKQRLILYQWAEPLDVLVDLAHSKYQSISSTDERSQSVENNAHCTMFVVSCQKRSHGSRRNTRTRCAGGQGT